MTLAIMCKVILEATPVEEEEDVDTSPTVGKKDVDTTTTVDEDDDSTMEAELVEETEEDDITMEADIAEETEEDDSTIEAELVEEGVGAGEETTTLLVGVEDGTKERSSRGSHRR